MHQIQHDEVRLCGADSDPHPFDTNSENELIRKVDWRLLPILGILYSIALIDRANLSNALVAGLERDLALSIGSRYSIALVVFFPPSFLFALPSNLILRRVGAANWLAFIAFGWGTIVLGQGFVKSYYALTVCRALLGLFEAGFFPGCVYLISCWYVRCEVQKRLAAFYLISVFFSGFANILAYAIMQMDGLCGIRGWQWIFGLITQLVAIAAWFLIVDFPDKAARKGFLTSAQVHLVVRRIEADRADAVPDPLTCAKFFKHLGDLKLWAFALMFMSTTMPAYALTYFGPVIIRGLGFSGGVANLLSAPPVFWAIMSSFAFAWFGDKYRVRAPVIAAQAIITLTGLLIAAYHSGHAMRYFGLFLGFGGCQGNVPAILAYQANNIRFQSKRSVGSALQIGFGSIGGIIASTVFRQADSPRFLLGLWITVALQFLILALLTVLSIHFATQNRKFDQRHLEAPIEGLAGFKYTI